MDLGILGNFTHRGGRKAVLGKAVRGNRQYLFAAGDVFGVSRGLRSPPPAGVPAL